MSRRPPVDKTLMDLLKQLKKFDKPAYFHFPVPKSVPGYHELIRTCDCERSWLTPAGPVCAEHPMDFSTMQAKIGRGQYRDLDAFQADLNKIINNCLFFNPVTSEYHQAALALRAVSESLMVVAADTLGGPTAAAAAAAPVVERGRERCAALSWCASASSLIMPVLRLQEARRLAVFVWHKAESLALEQSRGRCTAAGLSGWARGRTAAQEAAHRQGKPVPLRRRCCLCSRGAGCGRRRCPPVD